MSTLNYPIGSRVLVREEYRSESKTRTMVGVVTGYAWNYEHAALDALVKFPNGISEPFFKHELVEVVE